MSNLKKEIVEQMLNGVVVEAETPRLVSAEEVANKVFDSLTVTECKAYLSDNATVKDLIGKIVSFDKVDKEKELVFFNSYVDAVEPITLHNCGMEELDKMVRKLFQENDGFISKFDSVEWFKLTLFMSTLKTEIIEQMSDGAVIEVAKLRLVNAEELADKVIDSLTVTECKAYLRGNSAVEDLIEKIVSFNKVDKNKEFAFFDSCVEAIEPITVHNCEMEKLDKMVRKLFQETDVVISKIDSVEWFKLTLIMGMIKKEIFEQIEPKGEEVIVEVATPRLVSAEEVADKVIDSLTVTECIAYLSDNATVKDLIEKIASFDKVDENKEFAFFDSYVEAVEPDAVPNCGMEKLDKMVEKLFQENKVLTRETHYFKDDEFYELTLQDFWEELWGTIFCNEEDVMEGNELQEIVDDTLNILGCVVLPK